MGRFGAAVTRTIRTFFSTLIFRSYTRNYGKSQLYFLWSIWTVNTVNSLIAILGLTI